jgi:hypothetical protein
MSKSGKKSLERHKKAMELPWKIAQKIGWKKS